MIEFMTERALPLALAASVAPHADYLLDGVDIFSREAERTNLRYREPERFKELRRAYFEWDESMPPIPEDAKYTLADNDETLAKSVG